MVLRQLETADWFYLEHLCSKLLREMDGLPYDFSQDNRQKAAPKGGLPSHLFRPSG